MTTRIRSKGRFIILWRMSFRVSGAATFLWRSTVHGNQNLQIASFTPHRNSDSENASPSQRGLTGAIPRGRKDRFKGTVRRPSRPGIRRRAKHLIHGQAPPLEIHVELSEFDVEADGTGNTLRNLLTRPPAIVSFRPIFSPELGAAEAVNSGSLTF